MTAASTPKRARGGQPRAGEPMTQMLRVRFTELEWTRLEAYAEREQMTMSDVVRFALRAAIRT